MVNQYLSSAHFPAASASESQALERKLAALLERDYTGNMFAMLADFQRILADNRRRREWPEVHEKLATLFKCGRNVVVDGPMIGIPVSIKDSDYFKETVGHFGRDRSKIASIEWMATAWNLTFSDTGLWMGKTFEPVSREVVAARTVNNREMLEKYDPATTRIGRNYFREPPDPDFIQSLGLPVLTRLWKLRPRPVSAGEPIFDTELTPANRDRERHIPYSMTGGIFLAAPGASVVPEMREKAVYQLNYRWPGLEPVYPMTRLIDELVQIADGIYLGQLVFATRHYSIGTLHLPFLSEVSLGDPFSDYEEESRFDFLRRLFAGHDETDYGYHNNGYFLMMDPAFAREIYADDAFPQLRPRPGEFGYAELGYEIGPAAGSARPRQKAERWPHIDDWAEDWRHDKTLARKFTTLLLEDSPREEDNGIVLRMRRENESVLQMLKRISEGISAQSACDDRLVHFEQLHRLFRAGIAPRIENGLFTGHGERGYNHRLEGKEKRDWYGEADVAHGFDFYHGATLNLHLGFADTLQEKLKASGSTMPLLYPGALAGLLADDEAAGPNVLDLVWRTIGKYIFPWAGKSFERISARKLSMLLDESRDLGQRYPERVEELRCHPASAPHYGLVKKAAANFWGKEGLYARHLAGGSWDRGMSGEDKAFWEKEAAENWIDGNNIQDDRILAADPVFKVLDMNYREPDPSLVEVSRTGPAPFARQGYIFLGTGGRESILPMNNGRKRKKTVFQFHYRYPMIGGPAPIGFCLDELVEIADGLFLGQLIYATALDVPFHSSVDPARYSYQLFGYFLLLDDAWQYHRQAIGLDVWRKD